ncbi:MAG: hypothetical protein ACI8VW_003824, partial [bacterium]
CCLKFIHNLSPECLSLEGLSLKGAISLIYAEITHI